MKLGFFYLVTALLSCTVANAANRVLIVSGGGSPSGNHHSQYLQTKTLAQFMQQRFGVGRVDVFFGVGNNQRLAKVYPDVHATFTKDANEVHKMFYGVIQNNRAATKKNVTAYFEKSNAGAIRQKDTLFVFVGGHGMPNQGDENDFDNNCMDMWSYDPKEMARGDWNDICLSKNELKEFITKKTKAKRTVFAMSQCYSGGFHQMSVEEKKGYPAADPNLCGFTAITEDLPASGCTAAVNEASYEGYERDFTEALTNKNVISGSTTRFRRARTMREAHYAAALVDWSIDIPTTTTDYYLQQWYDLMRSDHFKPRAKTLSVKKIHNILDSITMLKWDDTLILTHGTHLAGLVSERLKHLKDTSAALARYNPNISDLVRTGSEDTLIAHLNDINKKSRQLDRQYYALEKQFYNLRNNINKKWQMAVKADKIVGLTQEEHGKFEQDFSDDQFVLALADTTKDDPALADRFANYTSVRVQKILAWAKSSGDSTLMQTATQLRQLKKKMQALDKPLDELDREYSHISRSLRLKQQLAAAVALAMMNDQAAISELNGLDACERTAF